MKRLTLKLRPKVNQVFPAIRVSVVSLVKTVLLVLTVRQALAVTLAHQARVVTPV